MNNVALYMEYGSFIGCPNRAQGTGSVLHGQTFFHAMKTPLLCLSLILALLIGKASCADSTSFQYSPRDGAFPEDALPTWRKAGPGTAVIEDDKLVVELQDNHILFWMLGRKNGEEQGDVSAWRLDQAGDATVTFKVKCHADDPDVNVFSFAAAGKHGIVWLNFFRDRIQVGPAGDRFVPHDCDQDDVYRITISGDQFAVYSQRAGVLVDRAAIPGGATTWNLLWFGSTYPFGEKPIEGSACQRKWELSFVKWTNGEALFETPAKE